MRKVDLIQFINSSTSKQEDEEILKWLEASPQNQRYFDYLKSIWTLSALPQERANESEYLKFKSRFQIKKQKKKHTHYFSFAAVAASLLILFFMLKQYSSNNNIIEKETILVSNNNKEIQYYILPDGTHITLFPKAEINYNGKDFCHNRHLSLKGQAFFEVVSDPEQAFHVYTIDNIDIKVKGTKFFVSSIIGNDTQNNKFEAFLTEGKISVKWLEKSEEIDMIPGDMIIANNNMELVKISNAPIPKEVEALNSYFRFENATMREVLKKLTNYYKTTFVCNNNNIKDFLFTGDLNNETIESILTLFNHSMGIKSTKKDSVIILY